MPNWCDDKTIQDIGEMLLKVRQALKQLDTDTTD